jgi:two-component system, NarL family, response regulator LiaR
VKARLIKLPTCTATLVLFTLPARFPPLKRTIFVYALALAVLVFLLKFLEYRLLIRDLAIEFYIGVIAAMFTALGVWVGLKLTRKKTVVSNFQFDPSRLEKLGISKREYDVLELMAGGLSNQEIADKLFVSLNTVKTHLSNLFLKLQVKRRTQAVQKAKALGLIP